MGIHKTLISFDDKHFLKLKELQRKTKKTYDDLMADLLDGKLGA